MAIALSDRFTYHKLVRFVCPSVMMMICTSIYSVVEGLYYTQNTILEVEFVTEQGVR